MAYNLPTRSELMQSLPEFYESYGYDNQFVEILFQTMISAAEMVMDYSEQVKSNLLVSEMEAYRIYPYFKIDMAEGVYDTASILNSPIFVLKTNSSDMSVESRIPIWESLDDQVKIEILSSLGKCIQLSAKNGSGKITPTIDWMTLHDASGLPLTHRVDYLYDSNKIYLLGTLSNMSQAASFLIAKDIACDYKLTESRLGEPLGILYNSKITKPEYRDFLVMATYAAVGGPTIKNIKNAFNSLSEWKGVTINDKYSATGTKQLLWGDGVDAMTDFQFLISIPFSSQIDEDRLISFKEFLDVVKPAYSNYLVAWDQGTIEENILIDSDMYESAQASVGVPISDSPDYSDQVITRVNSSEVYSMTFEQGEPVVVMSDTNDVNIRSDAGLLFDDFTQTVIPEGDAYVDVCNRVHRTFPEYPLSFTASKNILTGNADISFKDNSVNITRYEVLRNGIIILTATGTGSGATINLTDTGLNGQPSGPYVYYARAVYEISANNPELTKYSSSSIKVTINR